MQALDTGNSVFRREVGRELATLFGTTPDERVLKEAVRTGVQRVAVEAEWRKLISEHTITGDGTTEEWALPADFRGLITGGDIRETDSLYALRFVPSRQEWLSLYDLPSPQGGRWTFDGTNILINPALGNGTEVKMAYVTTNYWDTGAGTYAEYPSVDTDDCVFPSPAVIASTLLCWRQFGGMPTEMAEQEYYRALAAAIRNDTGGPIITRASLEDSLYDFNFTITP